MEEIDVHPISLSSWSRLDDRWRSNNSVIYVQPDTFVGAVKLAFSINPFLTDVGVHYVNMFEETHNDKFTKYATTSYEKVFGLSVVEAEKIIQSRHVL